LMSDSCCFQMMSWQEFKNTAENEQTKNRWTCLRIKSRDTISSVMPQRTAQCGRRRLHPTTKTNGYSTMLVVLASRFRRCVSSARVIRTTHTDSLHTKAWSATVGAVEAQYLAIRLTPRFEITDS